MTLPATVEIGSVTGVEVHNTHGTVTFTGEPNRTQILIDATFSGPDDPARRGEIAITSAVEDNKIKVRVVFPDTNPPNIQVALDVKSSQTLPYGVEASTGANVSALTADGAIDVTAGNLTTTLLEGSLALHTGAGTITHQGVLGTDGLAVDNDDGDTTLRLPSGSGATVTASVTNGQVTFTGFTCTPLIPGGAAFPCTMGSGGGAISLQANGNVLIEAQ